MAPDTRYVDLPETSRLVLYEIIGACLDEGNVSLVTGIPRNAAIAETIRLIEDGYVKLLKRGDWFSLEVVG